MDPASVYRYPLWIRLVAHYLHEAQQPIQLYQGQVHFYVHNPSQLKMLNPTLLSVSQSVSNGFEVWKSFSDYETHLLSPYEHARLNNSRWDKMALTPHQTAQGEIVDVARSFVDRWLSHIDHVELQRATAQISSSQTSLLRL